MNPVIPREGVESIKLELNEWQLDIVVIPREGVESSSLSGYFDRSFDERDPERGS